MFLKVALCVLLGATAFGQAATTTAPMPEYDLVSTVKVNNAADAHLRIRMDNNAIYIEDASVKNLLSNVYGMRDTLIFNLPKWAETGRFDVQAKVLADDPDFLKHMTRATRRQVFERLLSDRFGVVVHTETRTSHVYEMVRVGDGPQLVENPPPAPGSQPETIKPGHNGRGNTSVLGTHLDATGIRIGDLCGTLARILDRSVVDKTGLTSFYDVTLSWSDEHSEAGAEAGPALFTALREQLGLKLVPAEGPVQVLVVDKATQPKDN